MSNRPSFAPLPVRACRDRRLTAGHWRTLALIAFHDRFNANKRGCYITQDQIAETIGSNRTSVNQWLAELVAWGYLGLIDHPFGDKRRDAYTVNYCLPGAEPAPE